MLCGTLGWLLWRCGAASLTRCGGAAAVLTRRRHGGKLLPSDEAAEEEWSASWSAPSTECPLLEPAEDGALATAEEEDAVR